MSYGTRYNPASAESILSYARLLLGKSLRQLYENEVAASGGKGSIGQAVEKFHFGYEPNSYAGPDFYEAGIELKCTPLKENSDGSLVSKERLVLNIIDYVKEADTTFETSSFWKKNKLLLLMFYLHEKNVDIRDLLFKIIRLWTFPEEDLKIIKDDWDKIHKKIIEGRAHELSEGDTLYLGACTKGDKGGKNKRKQYNSPILADQRAYSLKSKYVNTIILDSLLHPEMVDNIYVSKKQRRKILSQAKKTASLVNSLDDYKEGETFEDLVAHRFEPYYGKDVYEIEKMLGTKITGKAKAVSNAVVHAILGVKTPKIKEFEKAGIQQKTIRLEPNGGLKESMAFSQIDYGGIARENRWEDSEWYAILTQRFLFIVFRKDASGDCKMSVLEKVFFWTMPFRDLKIAKSFWEDTRDKVRKGDFNHFISISDDRICHVRPKAERSSDMVQTTYGMQKKKGYWLNRSYILSIVKEEIETDGA